MERYVTKDGAIAKYVHDDGSETSIKTWPKELSCGKSGRNKFNVFASCSSGCPVFCKFCFLTAKNYSFMQLAAADIIDNAVGAVKTELEYRPELQDIPMNLSWMGMGDPFFGLSKTVTMSVRILKELGYYVKNFEGVDIGTTLPVASSQHIELIYLEDFLKNSGKLTARPESRSSVRIFYSLHSLINSVRSKLIPNTVAVYHALAYLKVLKTASYNVICHCLFLDGVNDSDEEIQMLARYFEDSDMQLRILRYNQCLGSKYKESEKFEEIIEYLFVHLGDNLKVQVSPGSEIAAACGMFLMKGGIKQ